MTKKTKHKLNLQQERFCQLFATDKEFFCNGVQSYIEAYNINLSNGGSYNAAKSNARRLLTNDYILDRINELVEINGLNNAIVDKQLGKVVIQDYDLSAKLGGIREYNKLKNRTTTSNVNISGKMELEHNRPLEDLDIEELKKLLKKD